MEEAHLHEQEEVGVLRLGSLPGTLPDVLVRNVDTLNERTRGAAGLAGLIDGKCADPRHDPIQGKQQQQRRARPISPIALAPSRALPPSRDSVNAARWQPSSSTLRPLRRSDALALEPEEALGP